MAPPTRTAPSSADSLERLLADQDALAAVLLAAALDDPAALFRAESVCKAMRAAAQLAWLPACARTWPQCAVADAAAARAACAAHGAAAACPGAAPQAAPTADASKLIFTVRVSAGASKAPLFVGSTSGAFLSDAQKQRTGDSERYYDCASDTSLKMENLLAPPPPMAVPHPDGASPDLRAALYVQRVRRGRAEVACLDAGRAHPWPCSNCTYDISYSYQEARELNTRQAFIFEAPTARQRGAVTRPLPSASKGAYGGKATWSTCIDIMLHVQYEPQERWPLPPPAPAQGSKAEDASSDDELPDDQEAFYEGAYYDSQDECWYAAEAPKRVAQMHAKLHVQTRLLQGASYDCDGYGSDGPGSCATTAEDLAAVLDSLNWHEMP
jgi:hypothetical protein